MDNASDNLPSSPRPEFRWVRKAARDGRDARRIDLNGLRCLLVSDSSQRLASFSLCVSCGHADDSGIAALQEAVRTSERFVRFEDFIKLNNGAVYTADVRVDFTVYGFEVHQSALTLAAVKFAEVLAARELGSVAGRKCSFTNIYARSPENEVLAGLLGPDHPFSKLLAFYQQQPRALTEVGLDENFSRFYGSARCSLALSGSQSVDELVTIAEKFARIFPTTRPLGDGSSPRPGLPLDGERARQTPAVTFPRDSLRKIVVVNADVPSKLVITWPLSAQLFDDNSCKPLHFVSYLLQQDRPGSLLDVLRREGLVSDLQIIIPENELETNRRWKLYRAVFMTTALGVEKRTYILATVLRYLIFVHEHEIQRWIYDEAAISCRLKCEFAEVADQPRVAWMSIAVEQFAPEDCFLGERLMLRFDEHYIRRIVFELLHGSCTVILEGDFDVGSFSAVESEEDYGLVMSLPESDLSGWDVFSAYTANPLMPQRLDMAEELIYLEDYPNVIEKGGSYRLWYQFKAADLPKTYCFVHMCSDLTRSPDGYARAEIACSALERLLCNRDASDAGFEFSASTKISGISLRVVGFNDKFSLFLGQVVSLLDNLKIVAGLFQECRDAVLDSYKFRSSGAAYAENVFAQIYSGQLDLRECRSAVEGARLESVEKVFADLRNSSALECFVYGNCTAQEAARLMGTMKVLTSTDHRTRPSPHSVNLKRLQDKPQIAVEVEGSGRSTTILYYHYGLEDHNGAEVLIDILVHLLERKMHFHDASTYYLPRSCGGDTTGFTLEIASKSDATATAVAVVENAIPDTAATLAESSELDALLKSTKSDLRKRRGVTRPYVTRPPSHGSAEVVGYRGAMADEAGALFEEIREQRFRFGASALYGEFLQSLECENFRAWLHETLRIGWLQEPLCRIRVD